MGLIAWFKEKIRMLYNEIIQKLENLTTSKADQGVYIISSIDNNGIYIGRIKDILLDSSDDIVIETDIDGVDIIESINENEGVKCI